MACMLAPCRSKQASACIVPEAGTCCPDTHDSAACGMPMQGGRCRCPLEELLREVEQGCSGKTLRSGTPGVTVSQQLSVRTDWATAGVHAALGGVVGGSGADW